MCLALFVAMIAMIVSVLAAKESWIINLPNNFPAPLPVAQPLSFEAMLNKTGKHVAGGASDAEGYYAMRYLFFDKMTGVSLELGALTGTWHTHSETVYFDHVGWARILVEARPKWRDGLSKLKGNIYSVQAAICSTAGQVHYAEKHYSSGIVEFMSPSYLRQSFRNIYDLNTAAPGEPPNYNWTVLPSNVITIDCIPLSAVFSRGNVKHVDWFVLDVEGAELDILHTIDWTAVIFDVICIETHVKDETYHVDVIKFMESQGYFTITPRLGRNSWFRHKDFKPSIQPGHEDTNPFKF
jgi:hypothetical protein